MSKKYPCLTLLASALLLASNASAALVARWTFNNSPNDQVGALNWALNGGATYATDAKEGSHSLRCDGVDDYASLAGSGHMANLFTAKTVMLWFKANATTGTQVLYDEGGYTNGLAIRLNNGALEAAIQDNQILLTISTPFSSTSWAHVAVTFGASTFTLFLDGTEVGSVATSFASVRSHTNVAGLGARNGQDAFDGATTGDYYGGLIDDVQMYNESLSPASVREIMLGRPTPWNPSPSDGALDVTSPLFTWTAGGTAQWHDLYLGTDPNLGPQDLVGPRQVVAMYWHVPGLTPGTTYYWRVDAVEAGGAVWTGPVWTFMYAPVEAWQPVPADSAQYMALNPTLSWTKGLNAIAHELYLGADKAAVSEGRAEVFQGNQMTTTFQASALQSGTTYYWRVDEVAPDGTKVKGHVWSFETVPEIPVTNPNLAAWWPLDEGAGRRIVDRSGHGHHGDFVGTMTWANGYDGSALAFVGLAGEYVEISGYDGVLGR